MREDESVVCWVAFSACSELDGVRAQSATRHARDHFTGPDWRGIQSFPGAGGE